MNRKRHHVGELTVAEPAGLRRDLYQSGYAHGLHGGQLDRVEYFRLSFREGFRAAKLALRARRRREGLVEFPFTGRLRVRAL